MSEVIRIGSSSWWNTYTNAYTKMLEPILAVVDLDEPANRVVGYERAVTVMKSYECVTQIHINNGTAPPLALEFVSFRRLKAEARLLQLKDQIAKSGAKPTPPGKRMLIDMDPPLNARKLPDTAFPELKSPAFESREIKGSDGSTYSVDVEKDVIPLPALPDLPTGASPIRKVRLAQIREGLAFIDATKHYISTGSWSQLNFAEYLQIANEVFRVAAEFEDIPVKRLAWYEARVRQLKGIEHFMQRRVKHGTAPPQDLDMASFVRLQGEIDLLKLKAEVEPVRQPLAAPICQPVYCPPACICPRPRILPRLFRR